MGGKGHRGRYRLHPLDIDMTARRAGAALNRSSFLIPLSAFDLAQGLSYPGNIAIADAFDMISGEWQAQLTAGLIAVDAVNLYNLLADQFVTFCGSKGCVELADVTTEHAYIWIHSAKLDGSPAAANTKFARRSAVKALYLTAYHLGLHDVNLAASVHLPSRAERYVAALTDGEIRQLMLVAPYRLGETRAPAILAMAMLGASTLEITNSRLCDFDFTEDQIWLHDGSTRSRNRWIPIDVSWARDSLLAHHRAMVEKFGPSPAGVTPFAYHGKATSPAKRQASVTNSLSKLMKTARVYRQGENRVESIREWAAFRIFDQTGSIQEVALRLGMSSLDRVANLLDHDWFEVAAQGIAPPDPSVPVTVVD